MSSSAQMFLSQSQLRARRLRDTVRALLHVRVPLHDDDDADPFVVLDMKQKASVAAAKLRGAGASLSVSFAAMQVYVDSDELYVSIPHDVVDDKTTRALFGNMIDGLLEAMVRVEDLERRELVLATEQSLLESEYPFVFASLRAMMVKEQQASAYNRDVLNAVVTHWQSGQVDGVRLVRHVEQDLFETARQLAAGNMLTLAAARQRLDNAARFVRNDIRQAFVTAAAFAGARL